MSLNRLEGVNKDKSVPVTDAETSTHSCSKVIANNGDENSKKKVNKNYLAVKEGENSQK